MSQPEPESLAGAPVPASPAPRSMSPLLPLFLTVLVDVFALTMIYPLLPTLAQRYGASPLVATSLFACFSICQFISGPILGRISDRVGRKPTLIVSQIGTFAGLMVIALTNRIELLFLGRIIDGLTAGNLTTAQAYITDVTRPENRTKAFGIIGIAFGIGFLVGPALSGVLAERYSYHAPFLFAAGLSALSVVLTATLLPGFPPKGGTTPRESRIALFKRYIRKDQVNGRLLELFLFTWSFSMLMSGLALFLQGRMSYSVAQVGYVFAFSAVIGGSMQGLMGRAAKKLGEARLSLVGFGLMLVGYLLMAQASVLWILLVALGIGSIGSTFTRPTLTTMLTESVPETEHGLALGLSQAGSSIAQTIGPLLSGVLIGRGDLTLWALAAGGIAGAGFIARAAFPVSGTRAAPRAAH